MSLNKTHTFELPIVNRAVETLISENSETLISWIYQNTDRAPYNDPTVRVGLAIKILIKCHDGVAGPAHLMQKILNDIVNILPGADAADRSILIEEYRLVQKCTELDDLISLNQ